MTTEAAIEAPAAPAATATEASESIHAGYDRIANPEKVQDAPPKNEPAAPTAEAAPAAEPPAEPAFDSEQLKSVMAQVARIPELEKQLRDAGGRYGHLKQSLEQLQKQLTAPDAGAASVDVDDMLKDIKEEFGEEGLYTSLKSAFSKMAAGRGVDPDTIKKMVAEGIVETKKAETLAAIKQVTDAHPTWMEDRETPEFREWTGTLSAKEQSRLRASKDPFYLVDKFDEFKDWKEKKAATPPPNDPPPKPAVTPKAEHAPSKRLTNAVMPTTGAKPRVAGEDDKATSIRAGYERVAGARMR